MGPPRGWACTHVRRPVKTGTNDLVLRGGPHRGASPAVGSVGKPRARCSQHRSHVNPRPGSTFGVGGDGEVFVPGLDNSPKAPFLWSVGFGLCQPGAKARLASVELAGNILAGAGWRGYTRWAKWPMRGHRRK